MIEFFLAVVSKSSVRFRFVHRFFFLFSNPHIRFVQFFFLAFRIFRSENSIFCFVGQFIIHFVFCVAMWNRSFAYRMFKKARNFFHSLCLSFSFLYPQSHLIVFFFLSSLSFVHIATERINIENDESRIILSHTGATCSSFFFLLFTCSLCLF